MATVPTKSQIQYEQAHIDETLVSGLLASGVVGITIAYIAVGLRFLCRRLGHIKHDWDDWLVLSGLILTSGVFTATMIGIKYGAGRHSILMSTTTTSIKGFAQTLLVIEVIYNFATFCLKASILYLYHRVFFVSRRFNLTLCAVAALVFVYSSIQGVGAFLQCTPLHANWNPHVKRHCLHIDAAATTFGVCNVLTDFMILILPMPILWKMQSPTKEKIQITAMFMLGGFVCFASIYRCIVIHHLTRIDPSWSDSPPQIWTMIELGIGTLSVCLPTMKPLFTLFKSPPGTAQVTNVTVSENTEHGPRTQSSMSTMRTITKPSQCLEFAHLGVLGGDLEEIFRQSCIEETDEVGEGDSSLASQQG